MDSTKVFLVDDHTLFRQALTGLLKDEESIDIIGESSSVEFFLLHKGACETEILLLDLSLEDGLSLQSVPEIFAYKPDIKIILLTMHNKPMLIKKAVNLGIQGYLVKNSPKETLLAAIGKVREGSPYLDPELSDSIYFCLREESEECPGGSNNYNNLSKREQEIFSLLAQGYKTDQIGRKLFISKKTVENHRFNIVQKLNLSSLKDIPAYAGEIGVI